MPLHFKCALNLRLKTSLLPLAHSMLHVLCWVREGLFSGCSIGVKEGGLWNKVLVTSLSSWIFSILGNSPVSKPSHYTRKSYDDIFSLERKGSVKHSPHHINWSSWISGILGNSPVPSSLTLECTCKSYDVMYFQFAKNEVCETESPHHIK